MSEFPFPVPAIKDKPGFDNSRRGDANYCFPADLSQFSKWAAPVSIPTSFSNWALLLASFDSETPIACAIVVPNLPPGDAHRKSNPILPDR
jgi:hypothetical protein